MKHKACVLELNNPYYKPGLWRKTNEIMIPFLHHLTFTTLSEELRNKICQIQIEILPFHHINVSPKIKTSDTNYSLILDMKQESELYLSVIWRHMKTLQINLQTLYSSWQLSSIKHYYFKMTIVWWAKQSHEHSFCQQRFALYRDEQLQFKNLMRPSSYETNKNESIVPLPE